MYIPHFCSTSTIKNAEADTSDMYSAHFRAHKTVSFQQIFRTFGDTRHFYFKFKKTASDRVKKAPNVNKFDNYENSLTKVRV